MSAHPYRTGIALLGGAACMAVAGFLVTYGALTAFERPLEHWYHDHNH